jgi:regulator of PEP synthase PpsR (kinase-PPPase family)
VPVLDATEVSIEEISTRILDRMGLERRLRP